MCAILFSRLAEKGDNLKILIMNKKGKRRGEIEKRKRRGRLQGPATEATQSWIKKEKMIHRIENRGKISEAKVT